MFSLCRFPETSLSGIDHKTRALAKWTSGASIGSPRPNLKSSRLSISGDRPTTPTRTSLSPLFKPTRTLSQPNLMEPNISAALRFDAYAVSPYTPHSSEVRPTRIPVLRTRTPSTSGHAQVSMVRSESRNGTSCSNQNLSFDEPRSDVMELLRRHRPRMRDPSIDDNVPRPSLDKERPSSTSTGTALA